MRSFDRVLITLATLALPLVGLRALSVHLLRALRVHRHRESLLQHSGEGARRHLELQALTEKAAAAARVALAFTAATIH